MLMRRGCSREGACAAGERLQQVAAGVAELKADIADIESQSEQSTKTLLEKGQTAQR